MKAVNFGILVQTQKEDVLTQKVGGFIVAADSRDYEKVKVLSVGDKIESDIKEGDTLLVFPNSGKTFTHDMNEYRVINISDVIVVL